MRKDSDLKARCGRGGSGRRVMMPSTVACSSKTYSGPGIVAWSRMPGAIRSAAFSMA
jgi:hypothetical protein